MFVYSERDILINYTLYLANNYAFIRLHPDTGKGPRICGIRRYYKGKCSRKMAPLRRKKGASPTASASPLSIPQLSPSRQVTAKTPMKSPLRQVRLAGVTKNQKTVLIENLDLECTFVGHYMHETSKGCLTCIVTERAKKLRSQCAMQAQALKQRIEMRINRVPKKLWDVTMGELLAQHGPIAVADGLVSAKLNSAAVKEFVEDVKRLRFYNYILL